MEYKRIIATLLLAMSTSFVSAQFILKTPAKYQEVQLYADGAAGVRSNGKWGFVDLEGKLIVPCIYDEVNYFIKGNVGVKKNDRWFFVNKKGEQVSETYDKLRYFEGENAIYVKNNDLWGALDFSLKPIVPCIYTYCSVTDHGQVYFEKSKNLRGIASFSGDTIIPPIYSSVKSWGNYYVCRLNDKNAVFNTNGDQITGFIHQWLSLYFDNGTACVYDLEDNAQLIDTSLTLVMQGDASYNHVVDDIYSVKDQNGISKIMNPFTKNVFYETTNSLNPLINAPFVQYEFYENSAMKKGVLNTNGEIIYEAKPNLSFVSIGSIILVDSMYLNSGFYCTKTGYKSALDYDYVSISSDQKWIAAYRDSKGFVFNEKGELFGELYNSDPEPFITESRIAFKGPNGLWGFFGLK